MMRSRLLFFLLIDFPGCRAFRHHAFCGLADVFQILRSLSVAPASHEQHDMGAVQEHGSIIQERGFFSQGGAHG